MLWSIDKKKKTSIPHSGDYDRWVGQLSAEQLDAIKQGINEKISDKEVFTAAWLLSQADWKAVPFLAIAEVAGNQSGLFLGILIWVTIMEREDDWSFTREADAVDGSMQYFLVKI